MTRRKRNSRRNPGLFEIASTSDWKVSAAIAAVCAVAAAATIPSLFGSRRVLGGLVLLFTPLAWLMAVVFASISLIRFVRQRVLTSRTAPQPPATHDARSVVPAVTNGPLSERDETPLAESLESQSMPVAAEARPTVWSRALIDRIEWKRFEDLCCEFYRVKGIRAETSRAAACRA